MFKDIWKQCPWEYEQNIKHKSEEQRSTILHGEKVIFAELHKLEWEDTGATQGTWPPRYLEHVHLFEDFYSVKIRDISSFN